MSKNKIIISIAGSELVVMTEESREYTTMLANTVDKKIRDLLASSSKVTTPMACILACLDLCDENEKVVAFGLCMPGIGEALQKSGGRLTLPALFRLLGALNKPKSIDLALVGILPKYRKTGIIAFFITTIQEMLDMPGVEYLETNLNLESNKDIQLMWSRFNHIQHKRRRSYKKQL